MTAIPSATGQFEKTSIRKIDNTLTTMNSTHSPPFMMTPESVSAWLNQISKLDTVQASHDLYMALKNVNLVKLENEDLVSILDQLTPSVLHLSGNLNNLFFSTVDTQGTIHRSTRKLARLSTQLIRSLCFAYCQVLAYQDLNKSQKTLALFTAFQLIGLSLKTHTLISERPSTTLWKKMGELYQTAAREALTEIPVAHKIPLFKNQKTIAAVLKRNLLYALLDLYRVPAEQLTKYYDIADQCAEQLSFTENSTAFFNFYWDTASCQFPQRGWPANNNCANLVFNTAGLAQCLQEHLPGCDWKDPIFSTVWQNLIGYDELIDSVAPGKPLSFQLQTGLASSIEQLRQHNRISNIQRLSAQLPESNPLPMLELVPMEHEKHLYQTRSEKGLKQRTQHLKNEIIYLLPARNPLFFLAQVKTRLLHSNLPVLLYTQQETPRFAVVRFIELNPETENQTALIETLPGKLRYINVTTQTLTTDAILIVQPSKNDGIILAPGKYTTGEIISRSDRPDDSFHLNRLIETNDYFMYYQLASD